MRPMADFEPCKAALVHDQLNDQVISWEPDQHRKNYDKHAHRLADGVIAWDGLLLDGWRPTPGEGAA